MASAAQAGYGGGGQPADTSSVTLKPAADANEEENDGYDEHASDSELQASARAFLERVPVQIFMLLCTVVALFSEDVRLLVGKGADPVFHFMTAFVFLAFLVELVLTIYVNRKENWFYTFLDFVATFSLILDLWFVQDAMESDVDPLAEATYTNTTATDGADQLADTLVLTRASRAARAGTKMGRLFKLTRLMRVGKMFKICAKMRSSNDAEEASQATDMSRRMAEIITGKVIIIVLVMLFAMPFLEVDVTNDFPNYGLDVIEMAQDGICTNGEGPTPAEVCATMCGSDGQTQVVCTRERCREDIVHGCVFEANAKTLVSDYVAHAGKGRVLRVTINNGATSHNEYITDDFDSRTSSLRTSFMSAYTSSTGGVSAVWDDSEVVEADAAYSIWRTLFVIFLLGFGSVLFGKDAEFLSSRITRPLSVLAEDMNRVSELDLDSVSITQSPIFEVNVMLEAFMKMKTGLTSFVKFVPRMVVRNLLKAGKTGVTGAEGVERKQLTIFFSNIANFEEVSARLDTLEMMEMLSEYFSEMSLIFEDSDGTLIEFVGDEILALWNAPLDVMNHQAACCDAALRMQEKVKECFDAKWQKKGWPWIDVKIGVNTANVFVGNLGAPDRMKYGVLGDGVNMAARLQMLNRRYKTKILGTQTIVDDPKVQETFRTRCVDVVAVKGKTIGVSVHEILSRKSDSAVAEIHDKLVDTYGAGFKCYKDRKFEEASTHLQALLTWLSEKELPSDLATEILLERCNRFAKDPPKEPWDGVDRVTKKSF